MEIDRNALQEYTCTLRKAVWWRGEIRLNDKCETRKWYIGRENLNNMITCNVKWVMVCICFQMNIYVKTSVVQRSSKFFVLLITLLPRLQISKVIFNLLQFYFILDRYYQIRQYRNKNDALRKQWTRHLYRLKKLLKSSHHVVFILYDCDVLNFELKRGD